MSQPESTRMLEEACLALFEDVQYGLMERSHELFEQVQSQRVDAGNDAHQLAVWLECLQKAEEAAPTLAGVRNALFHVFEFFKDRLPADVRHDWHANIVNDPIHARGNAYQWLLHIPDVEIVTSYFFRNDAWRVAWFRHEGTWWQFRVPDHFSASEPVYHLTKRDDVVNQIAKDHTTDIERLHEERLAVRFYTGEHVLYPWLLEPAVPLK